MTLTKIIWKIERLLLRAKCNKCRFYDKDRHRCLILQRHSMKTGNCMYYDKLKRK